MNMATPKIASLRSFSFDDLSNLSIEYSPIIFIDFYISNS